MPADRANIFLTLEEVMKEKCLDHVTTLWGLDEKTIEGDFKAVDTDEDGKLTLEEGMKVYEYSREVVDSSVGTVLCVYDCCYAAAATNGNGRKCGVEYKHGPLDLSTTTGRGGCETSIALMQGGLTLKVST